MQSVWRCRQRLFLTVCSAAFVFGHLCVAEARGPGSWPKAVQSARVTASGVAPAEDAAGVVDGKKTSSYEMHTGEDASPWWQVDLGSVQKLASTVVTARHCPERLKGFVVKLSDDGDEWRAAYTSKGETKGKKTFSIPLNGKQGRFLRIQVPTRTWMHLGEVEVFAEGAPKKNIALKRPADQSSVSGWSKRRIKIKKELGDWQTDVTVGRKIIRTLLANAGPQSAALKERLRELVASKARLDAAPWSELHREAVELAARWGPVRRQWKVVNLAALGRALDDLAASFPERYPHAATVHGLLDDYAGRTDEINKGLDQGDTDSWAAVEDIIDLQREILLGNPLLDFGMLLLVRRKAGNLGLPANWQSNCVLRKTGYDNDIAVLCPVSPEGRITSIYKPDDDTFVGDVDLHFDATRLMFSKPGAKTAWHVYEADIDPDTGALRSSPRRLTPDQGADVNQYDPCYLPNGDILYSSTAPMVAVPCVNGGTAVANLFRLDQTTGAARQLCFDQEHSWCPTVLNNGRVLYLRWEFADLPHSNSRILFHMNPDGTAQMEYYGSNSYWPNGIFYGRPIPGHPTQVVGIVTGHHGVRRMGELVLFDPARGRREADGVVQRIPGWGEAVEPVVKDRLVDGSWPRFLHPFPLGKADGRGSGKYFLVSMQADASSPWGIYLVDIFDNMLLLKEAPGYALLEPVPLRKQITPPAVPDRVDLSRRDAAVYLADIHRGPGLAGIPKGETKALRLFTYTYGYRGMGGLYGTVGLDGPWDVRRVLGTVPVERDGSAFFRVPANVPIAVQPLDAEGKALQLMRSWFTAMPGEVISCVGCHEIQNETPPPQRTVAARKPVVEVKDWHGAVRGFAFSREVQPVLDRHCVACHNGTTQANTKPVFSLRGDPLPKKWTSKMSGKAGAWGGKFSVGYVNLHRYVRHPGIESSMHLLSPMDFHADTNELVQILQKGHHGVVLTAAEWDRLVTWIDLNTPFHGDWSTIAGQKACESEDRRSEMRRLYAQVDEHHINAAEAAKSAEPTPRAVVEAPLPSPVPALAAWPWTSEQARAKQTRPAETIDLGDGAGLAFAYIPPGEFVMGAANGASDERPLQAVRIDRGFWLATTEVTNALFARFDPSHDSRREHKQGYQFGVKGYPLNEPSQPVVRVSWDQARAFCTWLKAETGLSAALPTEGQWEYACRAGTSTPLWFGSSVADFAARANVADAKTSEFASNPYSLNTPIKEPPEFDDWLPKASAFNDGGLVSTDVGSYEANCWGLFDVHGNVAEWTRSLYRPYPYSDRDGRNSLTKSGKRVVRGGSWRDRPKRCTSSYRLAYRPYQQVFNVGFRVCIDADLETLGGAPRETSVDEAVPSAQLVSSPVAR